MTGADTGRGAGTEAAPSGTADAVFRANLSHELRTPLSGILIASELLGDESLGPQSPEGVRELARKVNANGRRLLAVIDGLLDPSCLDGAPAERR